METYARHVVHNVRVCEWQNRTFVESRRRQEAIEL